MRSPAAVCVALSVIAFAVAAEDRWTEFRGPSGTGHSESTGLPREWSETRNVAWKTRDPRPRLVLAGGPREAGLAHHRHRGGPRALRPGRRPRRRARPLRRQGLRRGPAGGHRQSTASLLPTPVIEAGRVYVHFGSYGTAALDTRTGKVLWERRDLPCNHWRGPGSSPILYDDLLIVHFDGFDVQYAVALDKRTGRTVWRSDRTHDFGTDDGDQKKGFATPVVIEVSGRAQAHQPGGEGRLVSRPSHGSRALARALPAALRGRAAPLRPRARLRRLRPRQGGAACHSPRRAGRRDRDPRRVEGRSGVSGRAPHRCWWGSTSTPSPTRPES